jgi:hypothetical protein
MLRWVGLWLSSSTWFFSGNRMKLTRRMLFRSTDTLMNTQKVMNLSIAPFNILKFNLSCFNFCSFCAFFQLNHTLFLIFSLLVATGCAGTSASNAPPPPAITKPIQAGSADISVTLIRVLGVGDKETLIRDPGWHEYILDIENRGRGRLLVHTVRIIGPNGRYLDGASTYEEITKPPDIVLEVAGDVAEQAAGTAAGQFIPYGGQIFGILSKAASASSEAEKKRARRRFDYRVLDGVELAASGRMNGSAFLPNIPGARALVVTYTLGGSVDTIEIPLPVP